MEQARQAQLQGDSDQALTMITRAVQSDPRDARARLIRASIYDSLRRHREAIRDYDAVLQEMPSSARIYHLRGRSRFKSGDIAGSIVDFDRAVQHDQTLQERLWERGISYYYARQFAAGARQFEEYQTYDASDVENVVWQYLCQAQVHGEKQAGEEILPLDRRDPRVPMMTIYALFRGQATPEDVLDAARAGAPEDDALRHRLFYAHLYLGLYFEARSDAERTKRHLELAQEHEISHYMWDVARVHLEQRGWFDDSQPTKSGPPPPP